MKIQYGGDFSNNIFMLLLAGRNIVKFASVIINHILICEAD